MENLQKQNLKNKIDNLIKEKNELKIELNKKIKENNIKTMFELSLRFPWLSSQYNYILLVLPDLIRNYNNFETIQKENEEIFKSISETLIEQNNKNKQKIKNY